MELSGTAGGGGLLTNYHFDNFDDDMSKESSDLTVDAT